MTDVPGTNTESLLLLLMQMLGPQAESLAEKILGRPSYGRAILTNDPTKTLAWNAFSSARGRLISSYLDESSTSISSNAAMNMRRNFYLALGYDNESAQEAAARSADNNILSTIAETFLITPKINAAQSEFGQALHSRVAEWDWRGAISRQLKTGNGEDIQKNRRFAANAFWKAGGELFKQVIEEATNTGIMGLGIEESSKLASLLIKRGGLDGIAEAALDEKGEINITKDNQRFRNAGTNFKRQLREYASAVNTLQDVIGGSMDEVIKAFEKFTGNPMVSMASGRARTVSNALRNVLMSGTITAQDAAALAAQQYALIAPFGGTLTQASQLSLNTAAAVSSGARVEGLSDTQLGEALNKDNARRMISGEYRTVAAAYVHWRQKRDLEDNPTAQEMFLKEMTKDKGTTLLEAAHNYNTLNNVGTELLTSALVDNTLSNPAFAAVMRRDQLANYRASEKDIIDRFVTESGRTGNEANTLRNSIKSALQGTWDPSVMQEKLAKVLGDSQQAARLVQDLTIAGQMATENSYWKEAFGMLSTTEGGEAIMRRDLMASQFRTLGDIKGVKGLAALSQMLTAKNDRITFAQGLSTYLGISSPKVSTEIQKWVDEGADLKTIVKRMYTADGKTPLSEEESERAVESLQTALKYGSIGEAIAFSEGYDVSPEDTKRSREELLGFIQQTAGAETMSRADVKESAAKLNIDARTADRIWLTGILGRSTEITDQEFSNIEKEAKNLKGDEGLKKSGYKRWFEENQWHLEETAANEGRTVGEVANEYWRKEERDFMADYTMEIAAGVGSLRSRAEVIRKGLKGSSSDKALIAKLNDIYEKGATGAGGSKEEKEFRTQVDALIDATGKSREEVLRDLGTDDSLMGLLRNILGAIETLIGKFK